MSEKLSLPEISEIAREVTRGYNPRDLPSLDDVAWAFPVIGQERTYYKRDGFTDRILNIQEGNAMYQLMLQRNLHNVLRFLSEGEYCHHARPVGDAEDMAYMHTDYWAVLPEQTKKAKFPTLELQRPNAFFWDNIPKELVKAVLKTDAFGRGAKETDEWGMYSSLGEVYETPEQVTRYLKEMRTAVELGRNYFHQVAKSRSSAERYPQLIKETDVSLWKPGLEFEVGSYYQGQPYLDMGRVISNKEGKITIDLASPQIFHYEQEKEEWNSQTLNQTELNELGQHGMLWKLVNAK